MRLNALDHLAHEACAVFQRTPVFPRPAARGQEFVSQVTVAVLDVDKIEAELMRQGGGAQEIFDQAFDLTVGQRRLRWSDADLAVQQRVVVQEERLDLAVVRAAETAGVGELQPDQEVVRRAKTLAVCSDQLAVKVFQPRQGVLGDQQLMRVGAPVCTHCHCLPTPHQLGAAQAEILPAPQGKLGRLSTRRAVPAFHGQAAETIANHPAAGQRIRLGQRVFCTRNDFFIEGQLDAQGFNIIAKDGGF